jgi:hypothetical protein
MASAWPGFGGITSMFSGLARGRQRSQLQQLPFMLESFAQKAVQRLKGGAW